MDKLTKEEVLHVANLARIELDEKEIKKYQVELKQLLDDVDKIKDVKGYDDERMIAPWDNSTVLREDSEGIMLESEKVLNNAPHHRGNYISVPTVINDNEGGA